MRCRLALGGAVTALLVLIDQAPAAADLPGSGIVTGIGNTLGGWAFDKVADGIASWVLGAVGSFCEGAIGFLQTSSRPEVGAVWFSGPDSPYASVRQVSVALVVGFAFLAILSGLARGDGPGMLRRIAVGLPATALAMVVVVPVVATLLELTDALSTAVLDPATAPGAQFLHGFGAKAATVSAGFAAVVVGLVAALAAMALWAELLVRAALVYFLVALSPVVFAATLWPAARGVLSRTAELLVAIIVSKFAICVALAVGVAALGGAGDAPGPLGPGDPTSSIGTLLVGTAILAVAAFSPFLILRLLPVASQAVAAQGVSRAPVRLAAAGVATWAAAGSVGRLAGGPAAALTPATPGAPAGAGLATAPATASPAPVPAAPGSTS